MKPLESPDSFHALSAQGWLELGNLEEANAELENIAPAMRAHPEVLEIRWLIHAKANKWEACLDIADAITKLLPENPLGWIHRSVALHALKRTAEARDSLLLVISIFKDNQVMHYNLACYECRLGHLKQAMRWLERAIDMEGKKDVRLTALEDPDLEPLWAQIGEI